jgi:hypothetical protein
MQAPPPPLSPTDKAEAAIHRAVILRRKAAKRTRPLALAAEELHLMPSSSPQAEDIPAARKKPRIEEPFSASTDEAARKRALPDLSAGLLPLPATDVDNDDANGDSVTDTQSNAGASNRATRRLWTLEEDAQLTRRVAKTSKKKFGKEYRTDWLVIAALVPGRTNDQCLRRWGNVLDPSIARGSTGTWAGDEDIPARKKPRHEEPLPTITDQSARKTAPPQVSGGLSLPTADNDEVNADTLTDTQSNAGASNRATRRLWTLEEDARLTDAVDNTTKKKYGIHYMTHWAAVAALVPGRTNLSVGVDGVIPWIPSSGEQVGARANGQKSKQAT